MRFLGRLVYSALGAFVAQEDEESPTNQRVGGLTPGFSGPNVKVSLGKTLNPTLLSDAPISVCMCVTVRRKHCVAYMDYVLCE